MPVPYRGPLSSPKKQLFRGRQRDILLFLPPVAAKCRVFLPLSRGLPSGERVPLARRMNRMEKTHTLCEEDYIASLVVAHSSSSSPGAGHPPSRRKGKTETSTNTNAYPSSAREAPPPCVKRQNYPIRIRTTTGGSRDRGGRRRVGEYNSTKKGFER
uniref:Uncharacterized protein n=1 Tax=Pseudictyota dubia TaxID=2749911 RepID=A0A7R9VF42_9STRA|mmetsp:Transcript_13037/g.24331  ORF Transcript_13037/g.24331 Transcript_13037/m.24331 type:complete len:157 (+) Transcript_13037:607-1077(+)